MHSIFNLCNVTSCKKSVAEVPDKIIYNLNFYKNKMFWKIHNIMFSENALRLLREARSNVALLNSYRLLLVTNQIN